MRGDNIEKNRKGYLCQGSVYHHLGNWGDWHQCERKGIIEADGKHYCGIHNPAAVARRNEKSKNRFEQEMADLRYKADVQRAKDRIVEACREFINSSSIPESLTATAKIRAETEALERLYASRM